MTEAKVVQSPLYSAMNNIVRINSSAVAMKSTQRTYNDFQSFIQKELIQIKSIELPEKYKIKKLESLNVGPALGRPANLIGGLLNGALDVGSFFGDFLGKKKLPKTKKPPIKGPGANPKIGGSKLKLGGFKALGIANALFAGLDFATGLAEGESVGKSAAGAGGALAGSLLGGAIGQTLIPVPGLGFVVGSMAGNFLGGYLADRGYEAATGEDKTVEQKTKERLKQQEAIQRERAQAPKTSFVAVLDKFENVVHKFEQASPGASSDTPGSQNVGENADENPYNEPTEYPPLNETDETYNGPISGDTFFPLPGGKAGEADNQQFGASRDGGKRSHAGLDMTHHVGALNAPVAAYKTGKVVESVNRGYNGFVTIDHGEGLKTRYYHTTPSVRVGDIVYGGQQIANLHPAGQNTHLHFEVYKGGRTVNPKSTGLGQKIPAPLNVAKAKEQSEKSLGQSSVASGTNPQSAPPQAAATGQTPGVGTPKPQQDLSKMSTDQLKSQLDPTMTAASNPAVVKASQEARTKGQESGLTGEALEREVMIASIRAKESVQVQAIPQQQVTPRQIEQYPSYNQPTSQFQSVIMPILMGGGSPQKMMSSPQYGGGGSNGGGQLPSQIPQGKLVNSLLTTILLTKLSDT
jgi:murein DD-endopeptidase MepM/ murein hydrolase activator NlpD